VIVTDRRLGGEIKDVALLDLTPLTSAEDVAGITRISDVAVVLVPESLMGAVTAIPMNEVAMVLPVPDGVEVRIHTGALVMGGEALAGPGVENAALIVTGTLILTSPVLKVDYRQVLVMGLVLAPHGSEAALGAGLTRVTGSVDYYPYAEDQEVNVSTGQLRTTGEVLANPNGNPDDILVVAGQLVVTGPVAKVGYRRIVVAGQVLAPRHSQAVLGPVIVVKGQLAWYEGQPRLGAGPAVARRRRRADPPGDRPTGRGALDDLVVGVQRQAQHGHRARHRHPGARARRLPVGRPRRIAPTPTGSYSVPDGCSAGGVRPYTCLLRL
jgi:hypothetical protein